ncbi:cation-translocating P-type ATPase [Candidatus Woesearchaeota archaeon]|nr:cation-translocating P-type ATPase [Candidatus Woesearchaeota archaeon]
MEYFSSDHREVFARFRSSEAGLADGDAEKRISEYGFNEIRSSKRNAALRIFASQFTNFLIVILLFASGLSFFLKEYLEGVGMLVIALISVSLGFIQEYRAERAMEALKKLSAPTARVLRNGNESRVPARGLVPGDVILLEAGDIVAADCRVFEESNLEIDQSTLTGESMPARKSVQKCRKGAAVDEQSCMAFMGTVVTNGKGKALVTSTGMATEFGRIAKSLEETEESKTPLQVKFEHMARRIGFAVMGMIALVFLLGLSQGSMPFTSMLIFSVSLAVASVPSSLPAIVTIGLAMGANSLAKKNMIIKKLPATESLGSVTVICSDKTGTITRNQMTATKIFFDGSVVDVTGVGYRPDGQLKFPKNFSGKGLDELLSIGVLCNNAKLLDNHEVIGDPTEGALIVLAAKARVRRKKGISFFQENSFDSERKMMSKVFVNEKTEKHEAYVKGAPDVLLKYCSRIFSRGRVRKMSWKDRELIEGINNSFAEGSLRVLALAYRQVSPKRRHEIKDVERDLVFYGLVGMMDPARKEVRKSVRDCMDAGIRVMIITGDHPATAKAVAEQVGLLSRNDIVVTGQEMDKMSDAELERDIDSIRIVARALPVHKLRIVNALKHNGHIVAMTGDGVNDAPALKKSDIGIAMGITGSDVSKEVSKSILADDNFASIVNAVSEGRNIYDKIIKSTRYLLSCNLGEIVTVFFSIALMMPLPLVPMQILLMNLLTDGLPALGLGYESPENDVMKRPPRNPKERLFSNEMIMVTAFFGVIMGLGTLFMFNLYLSEGIGVARTVAFTTLVMFEMFAVVGSRSLHPFSKLNIFDNKWLACGVIASISIQVAVVYWQPFQAFFQTSPIELADWIRILVVSSLGFFMMEFGKIIVARLGRSAPSAARAVAPPQ